MPINPHCRHCCRRTPTDLWSILLLSNETKCTRAKENGNVKRGCCCRHSTLSPDNNSPMPRKSLPSYNAVSTWDFEQVFAFAVVHEDHDDDDDGVFCHRRLSETMMGGSCFKKSDTEGDIEQHYSLCQNAWQ